MTRQKIQLALVFAATALVMAVYEMFKIKMWLNGYIFFPRDVTIFLTALIATVAAYLVQRYFAKAKEALQLSEAKYKSVVDNVGIGITIMNSRMEIVDFNAYMRKRCPHIDLSQRPVCYKVLNNPPRQEICSYCPVRKTLQDGQVHEAITETPRADGIHNFRVISSPLRDAAGQVVGAIKITEDVTEQKRAEESLHQSEEKYRSVLNHTFQFIGLMTTDGILLDANESALALSGVEKAAVVNKPFWEGPWWIHSAELQHKLREAVKQAAAGKMIRFEATHPALDGSLHYVDFSLKPVKDAAGNVIHLIPEGRDITERKQVEERLRQSCRQLQETQAQLVQAGKMAALGQLAAGIAHEINNPMSIISSSAEILLSVLDFGAGASAEQHNLLLKHLAKIEENVYRCKAIIQGLLDFARQDAEAAENVDLRVLVRDMLHLVQSGERAAERKIRLDGLLAGSTDFPACEAQPENTQAGKPVLPIVYGHARQLQQVLMNLTLNALDATLPGGEVTLAARQKDEGIEVRISDNGKGILPEHRPHLFEPFFTTKPVGKGTGLGLYLSHGIVTAHRGHIFVQSEENKGTTLAVWLPARAPDVVNEKR